MYLYKEKTSLSGIGGCLDFSPFSVVLVSRCISSVGLPSYRYCCVTGSRVGGAGSVVLRVSEGERLRCASIILYGSVLLSSGLSGVVFGYSMGGVAFILGVGHVFSLRCLSSYEGGVDARARRVVRIFSKEGLPRCR